MKKFKYLYIGVLSAILSAVHLFRGLSGRQQKSELSGRIISGGNGVTASAFTQLGCRNGVLYQLYGFYVVTALHAESVIQPIYHAGQLSMTSSSDLRLWRIPYADVLPDLDLVIKKSEEVGAWNYWVVRNHDRVTYHVLTGAYGDIPFTEALKGQNCKYDDSKTVVYPRHYQNAGRRQSTRKRKPLPKV